MKSKLLIIIAVFGVSLNIASAQSIIKHCNLKWTGVKNFREVDSSFLKFMYFVIVLERISDLYNGKEEY